MLLKIDNLHASVEGKAILKGIDYTQARIYRAGIAGEEASGLALLPGDTIEDAYYGNDLSWAGFQSNFELIDHWQPSRVFSGREGEESVYLMRRR